MTDPAIEAARRASLVGYQGDPAYRPVSLATSGEIAAAREALAPLKELHMPTDSDEWHTCEGERYCLTCREVDRPSLWPCDTARLIYADAELNPEGTTP